MRYCSRRSCRGIARRHGFAASFMSKTYGDRAGSGFHVHFSLLDRNGVNVFDDDTETGSDIMRYAVAGVARGDAQIDAAVCSALIAGSAPAATRHRQ